MPLNCGHIQLSVSRENSSYRVELSKAPDDLSEEKILCREIFRSLRAGQQSRQEGAPQAHPFMVGLVEVRQALLMMAMAVQNIFLTL